MNRPTGTARIAVLDIGKTNLKLLVTCEDGWPLETHSLPNAANTSGPYLAYDLAGLEEWFLDTLAIVSRRHAIGAVIATAHGCGAVLVDEDKPVLPMMDHEAVSPPAIDEAYARIAPTYREVFCGIDAGATHTFETCPQLDLICVPGGNAGVVQAMGGRPLHSCNGRRATRSM